MALAPTRSVGAISGGGEQPAIPFSVAAPYNGGPLTAVEVRPWRCCPHPSPCWTPAC